jgi:hypothetical protein
MAKRAAAFGRFVAAVPPPLSIGTLRLAAGREAKGFLVEAAATARARDITVSVASGPTWRRKRRSRRRWVTQAAAYSRRYGGNPL